MKKYFDTPTQVFWYDEEDRKIYGIAYKDEIICSCHGIVQEIEEIYKFAQREEPIQELSWVDFTEYIR